LNLLKAKNNEFPEFYTEYPLEQLSISVVRFDEVMVEKTKQDILEKGLINPIVVWSLDERYRTKPNPDISGMATSIRNKVFNVHVGNKRVRIARELGYTHISVYHVAEYEDAGMVSGKTQMREFVTNW
jgi:ParB-like chromosome segregation protein Spo0J